MTDDNELYDFSRRKLLAGMGTIGLASAGAGLGTSALLWDEETFGSAEDPNVLQAGTLDLKVDWEGNYYDDGGTDDVITSSDGMVDQPGPIIQLDDVKPGDLLEVTLSAHPLGNPAFLGMFFQEHLDSDNGYTEPEDMVDGSMNDSDGTPEDGDLDEHMNVVMWYDDDGDNLPNEFSDITTEEGVMDIPATYPNATDWVTDSEDKVFYSGKLADLNGQDFTLNAANSDNQSGEFGGRCFEADTTQYVGVIAWVARDIPGVDDNIIQGDRLEFSFGFDAIQCRHNVDEGGDPIDGNISAADNESAT